MNLAIHNCVYEVYNCLSLHLNPRSLSDVPTSPPRNISDVQLFMTEHFQGKIVRETSVPDREYFSCNADNFCELSLEVSDSIEDSIKSYFTEIYMDVNLGTTQAPIYRAGTTKLRIETFPSVLHLHLKRSHRYDTKAKVGLKNASCCRFPELLDLESLLGHAGVKYRLHSVLVHTGNAERGHYIVFIRPNMRNNDWFKFDDNSKVVRVSQKAAIDENFGCANLKGRKRDLVPTACMLIYVRDTAIKELLEVPSLDVSYNETLLLDHASVILKFISEMNCRRALHIGLDGFLVFGLTKVENLSKIFDEMPFNSNVPSFFKRLSSACDHLVAIADAFGTRSAQKSKFIEQCQNLSERCDQIANLSCAAPAAPTSAPVLSTTVHLDQFWISSASGLHEFWNQKCCDRLCELRSQGNFPQYVFKLRPESLRMSSETDVNISSCRIPCLNPPSMINDACIEWFFMALTVLFPAYMYLPCTLLGYMQTTTEAQNSCLRNWIMNFKSRRPIAVLLPVNLPRDFTQPISSANPGYHWVLIAIRCFWTELERSLSSVEVTCMDSFIDETNIQAALNWFQTSILSLFGVRAVFKKLSIKTILQRGKQNFHCGLYVMCFGLNFVTGTIDSMPKRLLPAGTKEDSSHVGLELRKMAIWDSAQDPPLLDACLYMCPLFRHVDLGSIVFNPWWISTPHYDLRKSLNIQLESMGKFLMSGYSHALKKGRHFHQENEGTLYGFHFGTSSICVANNVATDGPFFFSNDEHFVKVYCIGLLNHFQEDHASVSRASRAFHDASATSYFCEKKGWFCKTFGLICYGLSTPCCFVCIARQKLETASLADDALVNVGVETTESTGAIHGDIYPSNVCFNGEKQWFELIDCERSSLLDGARRPSRFFYSWYAKSVVSKNATELGILMNQLKISGLDATRNFFADIYSRKSFFSIAFNSDTFNTCPKTKWVRNAFLHLIESLSLFTQPVISGQLLKPVVVIKVCDWPCTVDLDLFANGNAEVTSLTINSHTVPSINLPMKLRNEDDTEKFVSQLKEAGRIEWDNMTSCSQGDSSDNHEDSSQKDIPRQQQVSKQFSKRPRASDCGLPNHHFLIKKMHDIGNPRVLDTIRTSMMRRFGSCGHLQNVIVKDKSEPRNALRREHFGCETVLVSDQNSFALCIAFISGQEYLALDTESTNPRHDDDGISLLQIGSTTNVFIFRVDHSFGLYSKVLGNSLNGKHLLCWGDDAAKLQKVMSCSSTFIDVQKMYSPDRGTPKGISDCVETLFSGTIVLNKSWTLSGWDNEQLTREQLTYATLDVVACYALYVAYAFSMDAVYERKDNHVTFFTFNIPRQVKIKHGFSFTSDFLGHFKHGSISRGFMLLESRLQPIGFSAVNDTSRSADNVNVAEFVNLLNSKKICCCLCTCFMSRMREKWWFYPNFPHSFSFGKVANQAVLKNSVQHVSENVDDQAAFFCLKMLSVFLQIPLLSACDFQRLKQSVCSDIYFGYIRETLGWLCEVQ